MAESSVAGVEYRDIHGFPDYRVGTDGSVWSKRTRNGQLANEWRLLSFVRMRTGYLRVALYRDGTQFKVLAHRLVLEAFIGPCLDGMEACHNNGNPADNRVENLRWGTRQDNINDRTLHGKYAFGERHASAVVNAVDVVNIRNEYAVGGTTAAMLGAKYGLSGSSVAAMVCGRSWRHVGGPLHIPRVRRERTAEVA